MFNLNQLETLNPETMSESFAVRSQKIKLSFDTIDSKRRQDTATRRRRTHTYIHMFMNRENANKNGARRNLFRRAPTAQTRL